MCKGCNSCPVEGKVWGGFLCLAGQSAQRCAYKAWLLPEEKVCLETAGQASVQLWTRLLGQGICPVSNLSRLWLLQTWQTVDCLTPRRHPGPCAALVFARARVSNNVMAVKSARHFLWELAAIRKQWSEKALCAFHYNIDFGSPSQLHKLQFPLRLCIEWDVCAVCHSQGQMAYWTRLIRTVDVCFQGCNQ